MASRDLRHEAIYALARANAAAPMALKKAGSLFGVMLFRREAASLDPRVRILPPQPASTVFPI